MSKTGYKERLLKAAPKIAKPGKVIFVHVLHDDDCAFWKGQECNCRPELVYEELDKPADD